MAQLLFAGGSTSGQTAGTVQYLAAGNYYLETVVFGFTYFFGAASTSGSLLFNLLSGVTSIYSNNLFFPNSPYFANYNITLPLNLVLNRAATVSGQFAYGNTAINSTIYSINLYGINLP